MSQKLLKFYKENSLKYEQLMATVRIRDEKGADKKAQDAADLKLARDTQARMLGRGPLTPDQKKWKDISEKANALKMEKKQLWLQWVL